jgi:type II secretory pathway predicted ATPase ExeA
VRSLPAVDTRVGLRYHLRRLEPTDVGAYLAHRLLAAGRSGRAFTDEAVALLAERSEGVPRSMNRLAKLALLAAAARGAPLVADADVGSVADDIALNAA